MTATATLEETIALDHAETLLVNGWRFALERGQSPRFVAALIEQAHSFEPRLGLVMEQCNGCETWVDDSARDEHGQLWCSDGCRDFASEVSYELRQRLGYEAGLDVRQSWPADIQFGGPR